MAGTGSRGRRKRELPLTLLICSAVLVGGGLLGWRSADAIRQSAELTSATQLAAARSTARQFSCLDRMLHRLVPEHASVFVKGPDLWYQRLTEFAFRDYLVVATSDAAQYTIKVGPTRMGACDGVSLAVTPHG